MLIILEGMSTSGKTMIQKALAVILKKRKIEYRIIDQNEGLPPETFAHLDSKKSMKFLLQFLAKNCNKKDEVIICDRFHLSHIAITNWSVEDMDKIETELLKYDPLVVQLSIDENRAKERLEGAVKHRGTQWVEELARRGKDRNSALDWFVGTQKKHIDLFNASKLPKVMFNTTNSNFQEIAEDISEKYIKR